MRRATARVGGGCTQGRLRETVSMAQDFETVRLDTADGVATLTLARPERLNSFTVQMHGEVKEALARVRAGGAVRCLVLTGAGRGFCAGQDLADRAVDPTSPAVDLGESIENHYKPLVLSLRALEMPTIAAVNGVAAGAGANLALACDLVFAARSASFIQSFSKIGLVPDSGGTWWLPRLVGPARAMGLALTAEKLSAEQAEQWGLIWKCVDDDALMPTVAALARQLAAGPTRGYVRTRQAMDAGDGMSLASSLDLERDAQRELGQSDDYREGVAAFMAKRAPVFTGR
jgi:2-(1,2-epoxy-1,2-dihydrophenyl)acetyl-CoA isomerase